MSRRSTSLPLAPEVIALVLAARDVLSRPTDILNLEALMNALGPFANVR